MLDRAIDLVKNIRSCESETAAIAILLCALKEVNKEAQEACAKVCEAAADRLRSSDARGCAAAIRNIGIKEPK